MSSRNLRECGDGMLTSFRRASSSPPPSALRMRWVLTLSSTNDQVSLSLDRRLCFPSVPALLIAVGTTVDNADFEIEPFNPAKWPPTRATTSSELCGHLVDETKEVSEAYPRTSQRPSVAKTKNRKEPGVAASKDSLRCVTSGLAVTYGGVSSEDDGLRIVLPVPAKKAS